MTPEPNPEIGQPTETITFAGLDRETLTTTGSEWWRSAVIYQIYPRSFADSDGDGLGDLAGVTSRLGSLAELGVDAIWLSPFFTSPQHDAGYDVADYCDVDPRFGTLADFDTLLNESHKLGIRVIVDLVPNHTSWDHQWFKDALASPEGSVERDRYMFRDGLGPNGDIAPNNWESVFGGPMWSRITNPDGTPGQWYLHIFDISQPDLNWENEWVRAQFRDILRFWLDRGADGFRVDVAHGLIKEAGLPDYTPPAEAGSMGGGAVPIEVDPHDLDRIPTPPYWAQDGVHEIYRDWNKVLSEYDGERVLCAEAWVEPLGKLARWVRDDEMHQAFNFTYLSAAWSAPELRLVIDTSIAAFATVGAPSTWVLSNHDVVRHATRLSLGPGHLQGDGIGPKSVDLPEPAAALRRARAASAVMLALPGSSYIYQGEELGLPESIDLPDEARQDPTWFRTHGERYGRDGCRVPIPWEAGKPSYGFGPAGASWLPQPSNWDAYARDAQSGVPGSTLELYKLALALRAEHDLGFGTVEWIETLGFGPQVVAFSNGSITVIANTGTVPIELPLESLGELLLASEPVGEAVLLPDTTVWLRSV
ncbi:MULTISPECIES: alpha-amylase family glycosyl hydrolase [Subtercola]|uniref:Glycoside hydrolase family 13 protein n=1 Tax=Subtercola vilae TaxID=2056433 RepID=A0A4T2C5E9_9MICO|nr:MULTISPECIES: alpha-amylase family glycosyl hydrolase [Subtercola]MEA9984795.1 alpha-amylase family glycosyl hydrolase [Subtercola sp. RTI3]TIH38979.1 glycoside hydrolase family 13 protein [Subtercola vilae]